MYRIIFILISVLLFNSRAFCAIQLILHQSVNLLEENIYLRDIASLNNYGNENQDIQNLEIPAGLYADGFIDRKEVISSLRKNTNNIFFIYGNAVRVKRNSESEAMNKFDSSGEIKIRKGDKINFIIKKNGIYLEISATAMNDGKINDEIFVKPEKNTGYGLKTVKGIIRSKDCVEAIL